MNLQTAKGVTHRYPHPIRRDLILAQHILIVLSPNGQEIRTNFLYFFFPLVPSSVSNTVNTCDKGKAKSTNINQI